jgi:hypothetical protein
MADPTPLGLEEDGDAKGYHLPAPPCPSQWTNNFTNVPSLSNIFRNVQWEKDTICSEDQQPEFTHLDFASRLGTPQFESDDDIKEMSTPLKLPIKLGVPRPTPPSPPPPPPPQQEFTNLDSTSQCSTLNRLCAPEYESDDEDIQEMSTPTPPPPLQLSNRGRKRKTSKDGCSEQQLLKNFRARQNYMNKKQGVELPKPIPTSHQRSNQKCYHLNKQRRKNTATAKTWVDELRQRTGSETSSILSQVLNHTPEGQRACEGSDRVLSLTKLEQQAAKMIRFCPKQSEKRVEYQSILQEGQSVEYMKAAWGATDSSIKRSRTTKVKTRTLAKICTSLRTPEVEQRKRIPAVIQLEIINHMKSQGHVNSGANTERYCIPSNFTDLYMDYRKCYPDMLRRLHDTNALEMTYKDSQLQRNISLAVSSTDAFTAIVAPCTLHKRRKESNKSKKKFTGNSSRDTVTLRGERGIEILKCTETGDAGLDSSDLSEMFDVSEAGSTSSEAGDNSPKPQKKKKKKKKKKYKKRSADMIYPPTYQTWRNVLRKFRNPDKSKFLFTLVTQPYSCVICDTAAKVELDWQKVCKETTYYRDNEYTVPLDATPQQKREAEQKWNRCQKKNLQDLATQWAKIKKLEDHRRMYATQRRFLVASEKGLPSRTKLVFKVIVYQDYVAQYDHNGKKCSNLVFTIVWRDEKGQLRRKYVDNFCTQRKVKGTSEKGNKSDRHYTVMVWARHLELNKVKLMLRRSDLSDDERKRLEDRVLELVMAGLDQFDGVTHILRTGDSGAHFHNQVTVYFESSVYQEYGIEWETHTLCKRHAYNLCDAHGGAGKRKAKAAAVAGYGPESAQEFAAILNGDALSFGDTRAFAIEDIPRPDTKNLLRTLTGMQKACEFQYFYTSADGKKIREVGVVRFRRCSGVDAKHAASQFHTWDMNKRGKGWGAICLKCTYSKQRPVYHSKERTRCELRAKRTGSVQGEKRIACTKTPNEALEEYEQHRLDKQTEEQKVAIKIVQAMQEAKLTAAREQTKVRTKQTRDMKKVQKHTKDYNNSSEEKKAPDPPQEQKVENDAKDNKNSSEEKKAPEQQKVEKEATNQYELDRLARIAENTAQLKKLGLPTFRRCSPVKKAKQKINSTKDQHSGPVVPQRKSLRLSNKPVANMGEVKSDDEDDDESSGDDDIDEGDDNDKSSENDSEEVEPDSRTFTVGATVFVVDANADGEWELFKCKIQKKNTDDTGHWWLTCTAFGDSAYSYSTEEVFSDQKKAQEQLACVATNNDV